MSDQGLYVLWLTIDKPVEIQVGALGKIAFQPGGYAYVGSAQRHRTARINRHLKVEKPKRWHIDYVRPYATIDRVTLHDGSKDAECALVQELLRSTQGKRAHPQFGSSDCRCGGHLIALPAQPEFSSDANSSTSRRRHPSPATNH